MPAPKAVSSATRTPGFYLLINLLAGASAPGSGLLKGLLVAHKLSTGDPLFIVESTVRRCYGPDDVALALGPNSPGHLWALQAFLEHPTLPLDVVAPIAPAGATATGTFTNSGTPTDTNTWEVDIKGLTKTVDWFVGETVATFRSRLITTLNSMSPNPTIASANAGAGITDVNARGPGVWGNDITIGVKKLSGSGGTLVVSGAKLTGGTGEFDVTAALNVVSTTQYHGIGLATSSADAESASATSNPGRLKTYIDSKRSGLGALLQYGYAGATGSIANVKVGAIGRNFEWMGYPFVLNAQSMPCEVTGAELGMAIRYAGLRPNYNRLGLAYKGLIGSKDTTGDKLSQTETEDLLQSGVTPIDFQPGGTTLALVLPVTTHTLDGAGNVDARCYFQTDVFGVMAISDDVRVAMPQQFANASLSPDLPPGADSLPEGVVERRDVEAWLFARLRSWVPRGVMNGPHLETQITEGAVIVEIDDADESQINWFDPMKIVKPLTKFSGVVHKVG